MIFKKLNIWLNILAYLFFELNARLSCAYKKENRNSTSTIFRQMQYGTSILLGQNTVILIAGYDIFVFLFSFKKMIDKQMDNLILFFISYAISFLYVHFVAFKSNYFETTFIKAFEKEQKWIHYFFVVNLFLVVPTIVILFFI